MYGSLVGRRWMTVAVCRWNDATIPPSPGDRVPRKHRTRTRRGEADTRTDGHTDRLRWLLLSVSLSSQIDSRHHARASERTSNRPTGDCELRTSKRAAAAPAVAAPPRVGRPRLPLTFPNTNPDSLHRKTPNTANKNPHTTQITETYACTLLWYPHSVDLRICFSFIVTNLADYFLYTFSHFVSL